MKSSKITLGILLTSTTLVNGKLQSQNINERPNIVFILADDLGWADLPMYGNNFNEAPNLTKLAQRGIQFTNAYAAAPVSSPTRASIQSGKYPSRIGMNDFIPGHFRPFEEVIVPENKTQFLPENIITIGELLQSAGYKTGYFGKWHLGDNLLHHPLNQGYDEANIGQGFYNVKFVPDRKESEEKIMADRLAEFGIDFIEKNKNSPFFLFISHWDVHCPYDAKDELIIKYLNKEKIIDYPCNALYAAMIEQMDQSIGKIIEKLEKENIYNNTLFIFFSDNGGCTSENKYPGIKEEKFPIINHTKRDVYAPDNSLQYIGTLNSPLRNEKGTLYEGGIRVPLIISWPKKIKKATINKKIVCSIDFYPTFADLAQTKKPKNQIIDGVSLKSLLYNKEFSRNFLYWHYPVYHHDVPSAAIRMNEWKLIKNLVTEEISLYNLNSDISETTDLSKIYPQLTSELSLSLKDWQNKINAAFPKKNPNFNVEKRFLWGSRK